MEEEVVEGDELLNNLGMDDMAQMEDGRWPRGHCISLGMDDLAERGGLVAGHGREAEVVNPTLSEKANSIKYVHYPVGLESLCQVKTFSGFAIKLQ
jgi:hypothetical protein